MSVGDDQHDGIRIAIALVAAGIIAGSVYISKQREVTLGDEQSGTPAPPPPPPPTEPPPPPPSDPAPTQQFEAESQH
jgi:K(+)-stimulated pyrophosphate-energized sodium pump